MIRLKIFLVLALLVSAAPTCLATDLVAKAITFGTPPRLGRDLRFGCSVANTNVLAATEFLVRFTVLYGTNAVFQTEVEGADLRPDTTKIYWTTVGFRPSMIGEYTVRAEVVFADEIDPSDNVTTRTFTPQPAFITLEQAVAKLQRDVLDSLSERNTLVAYHVRPIEVPLDSVHEFGATLSYRDGTYEEFGEPRYLFFVDLAPTDLWGHPAIAVQIPALEGSASATVQHYTDHPFSVNGTEATFGPDCAPNPNRVRGNGANCTPPPNYTMVKTTNTNDCVLIITGRVIKDVDSVAMGHDLKKVVDRLNTGTYGPRVSSDNITIVRGVSNRGATPQDVRAAFDALKARSCRKIYIKYIGHGVPKGLVLKDSAGDRSQIFSWDEFAQRIRDLGNGDVTVDVTACYSGKAVTALQRAGVRGTVVTSSDSATRTPQGPGTGTYWEEALRECSADTSADINGDGQVDVREAALWVKAKKPANDPSRAPRPQVLELNDSVRTTASAIASTTEKSWEIPTPGGSLVTTVEDFCVRTSFKRGSGRKDTTVCRSNIYITNLSSAPRNAVKTFEIVAICGRGSGRTERVITTICPQLGPRATVCVGVLPQGCTGMFIREVSTPRRMPTITIDSAQIVERYTATIVTKSGSPFRVAHHFTDVGQGASYSVATSGPARYNPNSDPPTFTTQPDVPATVNVTGMVQPNSAFGCDIITTLTNDATFGITRLNTRILTTADVFQNPGIESYYRYATLASGVRSVRRLSNSIIELSPSAGIAAGTPDFFLEDVVVQSESATAPSIVIQNRDNLVATLSNVVLSGIASLSVETPIYTIRGLVLGATPCSVTNASPQRTMSFAASYGARGNAFTFNTAKSDIIDVYGLAVEEPDGYDIEMKGRGVLRCTDCLININNTSAAFGSAITQFQNVSALVSDRDGRAVRGDTVRVMSSNGTVLASTVTDTLGIATFSPIVIGSMSELIFDRAPLSVQLVQRGGGTRIVVLPHTGWMQVFLDDSTVTTGIDDESSTTISTQSSITPMPLSRSFPASVRDQRGITHISIYGIEGSLINTINVNGAPQISLPTSAMSPGWYIILVHRTDGVDRIPVIVH